MEKPRYREAKRFTIGKEQSQYLSTQYYLNSYLLSLLCASHKSTLQTTWPDPKTPVFNSYAGTVKDQLTLELYLL